MASLARPYIDASQIAYLSGIFVFSMRHEAVHMRAGSLAWRPAS
jgi:hypothetical protein